MGHATSQTPVRTFPIPARGAFDADAAEAAAVVGFHLAGRRPPLYLLRTWSSELPKHRDLALALGADQPILSLAPPVPPDKDAYPKSFAAWADFYLDTLLELTRPGPLVLGGWSFGGVVAVELVEKLAAHGREALLLALLDSRRPKERDPERERRRPPRRTQLEKLGARIQELGRLPSRGAKWAFVRRRTRRRIDKTRRKLVRLGQWLVGYEPPPPPPPPPPPEGMIAVGRHKELVMTPLTRAIRITYGRYSAPRSSVPIALFWTAESLAEELDSSLGWAASHRGPLHSEPIPGEHWTMFEAPHVGGLARRLERVLAAAWQARAGAPAEADADAAPRSAAPAAPLAP